MLALYQRHLAKCPSKRTDRGTLAQECSTNPASPNCYNLHKMDDGRKWHLAWAQLDAFANNLPMSVKEKHVAEFHSILALLHESSAEEVEMFRIPDGELKRKPTSVTRMSMSGRPGHVTYSEERYCDHDLMLRKIEAVRNYFTRIVPPEVKPRMGF